MQVIPLGGCGEFGRNLTAYVLDGRSVLVDCGLQLADELAPGVDYFVPDLTGLIAYAPPLALLLTHGHDDHIGAVPHLLRTLGTALPVYGRGLTLRLLKTRLDDARVPRSLRDMRDLPLHHPLQLGPIEVIAFALQHSIPECCALLLRTAGGLSVLHTGDFKLDGGAQLADLLPPGPPPDLLVGDSTNAARPGRSGPETVAQAALAQALSDTAGRLVVTLFSSHVERVRHFAASCVRAGRRLCLLGRGLREVVAAAEELRLLRLPATLMCDEATAAAMAPGKLAVLCTGSQGEPDAALARLARATTPPLLKEGRSRRSLIRLGPGDRLVLAARTLPAGERPLGRILDRFILAGVEVLSGPSYAVSGHACQDELRELLACARPRMVLPVHGTPRQMSALARLAAEQGIPALLCQDGDVVKLGERIEVVGQVRAGWLAVEGRTVGEIGPIAAQQRRCLGRAGVVVVAADDLGPVEVQTVGVRDPGPELDRLCAQAATGAAACLASHATAHHPAVGPDDLREDLRRAVRHVFYQARGVRPEVIVVLRGSWSQRAGRS